MRLISMLINSYDHVLIKIRNNATKKSVLIGGSLLYFAVYGVWMHNRLGEGQRQKLYSSMTKKISTTYIPKFMRQYMYTQFSHKYGVNLDEVQLQLEQYKNFSEFFTRKVKERPKVSQQLKNEKTISCPCDSQILNISRVTQNKNIIVKDVEYSLNTFLFETKSEGEQKVVESLKLNKQNQLYQVIFYLSPADYHRFHSPSNLVTRAFRQIDGVLRSVSVSSILQNGGIVYQQNARKVLHFTYQNTINKKICYLGLVMVGAVNVSDIVINKNRRYKKGEQIGYFNLGSTVVMIVQVPTTVQWSKKVGDKVKFGQRLCDYQ